MKKINHTFLQTTVKFYTYGPTTLLLYEAVTVDFLKYLQTSIGNVNEQYCIIIL